MTSFPSTKDIGDRPLSLATHLRTTVSLLRAPQHSGYDWCSCTACNAGLLARTMLGYSRAQLTEALEEAQIWGPWGMMVTESCPHTTGEPWPKVLARLFEKGLEVSDLNHVERLSHPQLVDTKWKRIDETCQVDDEGELIHMQAHHVAAYLERWATRIEVFHAARSGAASEVASSVVTALDMERAVDTPIVQDPLHASSH